MNDLCGGPLLQHLPGGQRTALWSQFFPFYLYVGFRIKLRSPAWRGKRLYQISHLSSRTYLILWDTVPYWTWTCLTVSTAAPWDLSPPAQHCSYRCASSHQNITWLWRCALEWLWLCSKYFYPLSLGLASLFLIMYPKCTGKHWEYK